MFIIVVVIVRSILVDRWHEHSPYARKDHFDQMKLFHGIFSDHVRREELNTDMDQSGWNIATFRKRFVDQRLSNNTIETEKCLCEEKLSRHGWFLEHNMSSVDGVLWNPDPVIDREEIERVLQEVEQWHTTSWSRPTWSVVQCRREWFLAQWNRPLMTRRSRSVVSLHVQNCNIHDDKVESSPLERPKKKSSVDIANSSILRSVVNSLYTAGSVSARVM